MRIAYTLIAAAALSAAACVSRRHTLPTHPADSLFEPEPVHREPKLQEPYDDFQEEGPLLMVKSVGEPQPARSSTPPADRKKRVPASATLPELEEVEIVMAAVPITRPQGQLVYSIPDSMKVGKTYQVVVRIAKTQGFPAIHDGLERISEDTAIRVSSEMSVALIDASGNTFTIVASNSKQLVEDEEYTEWVFDVTPTKTSASAQLRVVVSRYLDGNLKQTVYKKSVIVTTTTDLIAKTFFEKYWQWIFSTLLLPLFLWFVKTNRSDKVNKANQV